MQFNQKLACVWEIGSDSFVINLWASSIEYLNR